MDRQPNAEQKSVISDFENNIVLFASAGTGKTFTVANKVKTILEKGLATPQEILCLTFTIKACGEMQDDINRYTGEAKGVNIKTIHGFCLDIIEEEGDMSAPVLFDDIDEEEFLQKLIPESLTRFALRDFLKSRGIETDIFKQNAVYTRPYGFFWQIDLGGEKLYINSHRRICYEKQIEALVDKTNEIICPDCGNKQIEKSNFCNACGCDFRAHVKPQKFKLRQFRNLVSAIKRHREIYGFYSDDEVNDYQKTYEKLKNGQSKKFDALISCWTDGGYAIDTQFSELFSPYAGLIVSGYNRALYNSNKVDFDDLITGARRFFKDKAVIEKWRNRYKYIIVDEMQDTSILEYSVLKPLFNGNKVMMCGDIFQTIYEWRGSEPFTILNAFKKEFNAKTYMFGENYRSTRLLTEATFGYLKNTYPEYTGEFCPAQIKIFNEESGEPIRYVKCKNEYAEAKIIYRYLLKHKPADFSQTCIMSRSNGYIARLYTLLIKYGETLPEEERLKFFTVDEDYRFFKKPVIKDILAFWTLILNGADDICMERLAERYIKGAGPVTLGKIRAENASAVSLTSFLEKDSYDYGDCYRTLIEGFRNSDVVIYDIETTGLDTLKDEIIQIAGVRLDCNGKVCAEFNKMVIPQREISQGALSTHGYDLEYIRQHGGVSASEALAEFSKFVRGCIAVGHNSEKFDMPVIKRQLAENGLPALEIAGEYDTLVLSKKLCPALKNYKLETLCNTFGIVNERAHDAFADVNATAKVLAYLITRKLIPTAETRSAVIKKYKGKFEAFYDSFSEMKKLLSSNDITGLNGFILSKFNILEAYGRVEDKTAVDDLLEIAEDGAENFCNAESCLRNLICDAALSGSQMDFLIKKLNKIPIITVHQSKGCEFETVILCGADNSNFPSFSAVQSGNGEEEKRVFYVAISRAKSRLVMTSYVNAVSRNGFGYMRAPSKFIDNIPAEYIEFYDLTE